jgi:dihydroorotase
LYLAREAADAAGLPIMVHAQNAWTDSLDDILRVMKARDILTHCFHGKACGILDEHGRVRETVVEAAARGVVFDVGHGRGSFNWNVAESAFAQGFLPQTISSDVHRHNVNGPVYDLATTASKLLTLGLSLDEVIAKVTAVPAQVIRQAHIGTLQVGAWGDAVLWQLAQGAFEFSDSHKQTRSGARKFVMVKVVKGGKVIGN